MALLEILHFPDPRLRTRAQPVAQVDAEVVRIIEDMFETMYSAQGVGLAASQVNIHRRILVMDVSDKRDQPLCLINPEIVKQSGIERSTEGCLSVPGIFEPVERAQNITINALDRHGHAFTLDADNLLAVCIQHEMDHLEGRLFVDYLSPLKRERIRKKLEKSRRQTL
jgi:peptide deformylase